MTYMFFNQSIDKIEAVLTIYFVIVPFMLIFVLHCFKLPPSFFNVSDENNNNKLDIVIIIKWF